jgi:hypothetical protein
VPAKPRAGELWRVAELAGAEHFFDKFLGAEEP